MNTLCPPPGNKLDGYLDSLEYLPPTPALMIRLIELFRRPDRDVDEIVDLMRQDLSVTAEVLRRCNSSFFANQEPVLDIYDAVFRMGFYEVYRITVALFGFQTMSAARLAKCIPAEPLWRHSAITAIVGGAIARQSGESEASLFTAGVLHDVGKIVLAMKEGDRYAELLQHHGTFGASLSYAEECAFDINHGQIGARLLERWGVPQEIFVPVLYHHQKIWSGPFERQAAIINLANLMAHCIEENTPDKPCEHPEALHAMKLLRLGHDDIPALEQEARNDIKRLSCLLAAAN